MREIASIVANEKWNKISTYEKKQILESFEGKEVCICGKLLDLEATAIDLEDKRFRIYEFVDEDSDYSTYEQNLIFNFEIRCDEVLVKQNLSNKDKIVEVTGKIRFVSVGFFGGDCYPNLSIGLHIEALSIIALVSDWMTSEFLGIPDYYDPYSKKYRSNDKVPSLNKKNNSSGIGCSLFFFLVVFFVLIAIAIYQ
jgi:hypothetical protein